jgi:nitrilase
MGTAGSPIMGRPIAGSSAVIGPDGRVLSTSDADEQLIIADLPLAEVTKAKGKLELSHALAVQDAVC